MAEEQPELAGKKKFVVNEESFYSVPRLAVAENLYGYLLGFKVDTGVDLIVGSLFSQEARENVNNSLYFNAPGKDKLRISLGKNWDFAGPFYAVSSGPFSQAPDVFSNNWKSPRLFGGNINWSDHNSIAEGLVAFQLEECTDAEEITAAGSFGLSQAVIKQKVVVSAEVPNTVKYWWGGTESSKTIGEWISYVKTGIISPEGTTFDPLIYANRRYFDHYHESINPFTPSELENKYIAGKAFFADFKTYYNEVRRSYDTISFENFASNNLMLQNALPNIYAFLRLLLNKDLVENDLFNLKPIINKIQQYYNEQDVEMKDIFVDLLKEHPLETLVTLYGTIGTAIAPSTGGNDLTAPSEESKIIEKIITTSFENVDAYSLFSDYHAEYTRFLQEDSKLQLLWSQSQNRIGSLERIMSNFVFSPECFKILNKVDQYKKYFPYYAEIEFTANIYTTLGDTMKQLNLTKVISEALLNTLDPKSWRLGKAYNNSDGYIRSWVYEAGTPQGMSQYWKDDAYVDYSQEAVYTDLSSLNVDYSENSVLQTNKRMLKIADVLETWLVTDNGLYYTPHVQSSTVDEDGKDLRNHITHFRNDYSDPVNLNDDGCNSIFKSLFGSAFYAQLMNIYNNKRRTYQDILDGKPAYTEDLFYRIEKVRTSVSNAGVTETEVVQNIMIPNTSNLDIVKYVDTQVKYSKSPGGDYQYSYKYNVYVHRIVFGSKYMYRWIDQSQGGIPITSPLTYSKTDLSNADDAEMIQNPTYAHDNQLLMYGLATSNTQEKKRFTATFEVVVEPDIVILTDKIFSTPEITILDRPPVIPDVNIVPYRAINDRIKILITGATDRYKAKPVIMLSGDEEEFNLIKKSQLVVDEFGDPLENGEVEFGSDDPVRRFQIFRINKKPITYSDFELYQEINQEFFEEKVLPNTKYYYTFRAIDDHGHFSNPTPVYEVELIDEKGAVKPIIRLVDMEPPKEKTKIKDCQKYIYLRPSKRQLYFSDNSDVDSIFSDSTNKKRYKMRITSKGSGKKIDINFSFKKNIQTD